MSAQAGILYRDTRPVPREAIETLSRHNEEHGPDRAGLHTDPGLAMLSFVLHFDRLSALERQPVRAPDGSVLTWDGRLDNRDDFLIRLERVTAGDHTDASLVALSLAAWQDNALPEALGDWSLAWWNARDRRLLLARDCAGTRDLYYCARPEYFAWSTTVKPLVDLCGLEGEINEHYLAALLTDAAVGHQTLYRGIFRVPGGHVLTVRAGAQPQVRPFFRFTVVPTLRYRDVRQYHEHYRALLTEAVKVRLRSSTPVWTELSGGYDSSSVTCVAASLVRAGGVEAPGLRPVSYVSLDSPESDENPYIEHVEHFCDLSSLRITLPQFVALFPDSLPNCFSPDHSAASPPLELAKRGCHVLLSGHFGDGVTKMNSLEEAVLDHLRAWRAGAALHDVVQYCRFQRRWLPAVVFEVAVSLCFDAESRSRYHKARTLAELTRGYEASPRGLAAALGLHQDFLERGRTGQPAPQRFHDHPRAAPSLLIDLGLFAHDNVMTTETSLPQLRRTYPYAHRPLLDFVLALPPSVAWHPGNERAFICEALRDVLPAAIVSRRSKGVSPPAFDRTLLPAVMDSLDSLDTWLLVKREYADASAVRRLLHTFLDGSRPASSAQLRRLVSAERLLRQALSVNSDVSNWLPSQG